MGCVGIDNARNAAVLAAQIIAQTDAGVKEKLEAYKQRLAEG